MSLTRVSAPPSALDGLPETSAAAGRLLPRLLRLPSPQLWQLAQPLVSRASRLLRPGVSRQLQQQFRQLWTRLSLVFPHRLWALTVNALRREETAPVPARPLTGSDLAQDPLHVLRCQPAVLRAPPLLEMVLELLLVHLSASRAQLKRHLLDHPSPLPAQPYVRRVGPERGQDGDGGTLRNIAQDMVLVGAHGLLWLLTHLVW